MSVKGRRRLLRISSDEEFQRTVPFLVYHAPEGSQTIDNSEEYERIRRCVQEGRDPYEGRHTYAGLGVRRKHPSKPPLKIRRPTAADPKDSSDSGRRAVSRKR